MVGYLSHMDVSLCVSPFTLSKIQWRNILGGGLTTTNIPCASVEPSVVDFLMYHFPDCDSFKSTLPLSFELAVLIQCFIVLHYAAFF